MSNLNTAEDNKTEFIKRLVTAGWTKKEASLEWKTIQNDEEGGL